MWWGSIIDYSSVVSSAYGRQAAAVSLLSRRLSLRWIHRCVVTKGYFEMSIPYSGTYKRSAGLVSALAKQVFQLNLKAVKKISVKFDPFDPNVTSTRSLLHYLTGRKVVETNVNCLIKTEVVCDRADPLITFNLLSGENVIFKSKNLSTLELLQLCNKHISALAPKEEPVAEVATKSKQTKATGKKR